MAAVALTAWLATSCAHLTGPRPDGVGVDGFSDDERAQLHRILAVATPLVESRQDDGSVHLLTFEELYAPLAPEDRAFLNAIRRLTPRRAGGVSVPLGPPLPSVTFTRLAEQIVQKPTGPHSLGTPYLPSHVAAAYERMMRAMERDLGVRLLVESGYRASAYQLYLFLFYLAKHGYSIRETNRFVALPGFSEHGAPQRQAIDFITQDGVNGEDDPEAFAARPEYGWLQAHAAEYGFALSYPRHNPWATSFEPWHWHYERSGEW